MKFEDLKVVKGDVLARHFRASTVYISTPIRGALSVYVPQEKISHSLGDALFRLGNPPTFVLYESIVDGGALSVRWLAVVHHGRYCPPGSLMVDEAREVSPYSCVYKPGVLEGRVVAYNRSPLLEVLVLSVSEANH